MTSAFDEGLYRAGLWQRIQLVSERERLIEAIRSLPEAERSQYASWISFFEKSPEEYDRFKRHMQIIGFDIEGFIQSVRNLRTITERVKSQTGLQFKGLVVDARSVVIHLSPRAANDAQLRKAMHFSTAEQTAGPPPLVFEGALGDELVKVLASSDPSGRRTRFTVAIDDPKATAAGTCLFVSVRDADGGAVTVSVELEEIDTRLQGTASVAVKWADFVVRTGQGLQIRKETHLQG